MRFISGDRLGETICKSRACKHIINRNLPYNFLVWAPFPPSTPAFLLHSVSQKELRSGRGAKAWIQTKPSIIPDLFSFNQKFLRFLYHDKLRISGRGRMAFCADAQLSDRR